MEEVKRRRGRPPKEVAEELPVENVVDTLAVEETSVQAKSRQHKELVKVRNALEYVGEKYYYLKPFLTAKGEQDNKIILVRKKNNGATYRTYAGRASKSELLLKRIKSEGLLKERNG